MKLKTLKKKIRQLETRLKKGPKKLARWKRRLAAQVAEKAAKAKLKSTARGSAAISKKKRRSAAKAHVRPATAKKSSAPPKVKRKLNLSPERRAQLAEAMRARWAAKRAAAETNPQDTSTNGDFSLGPAPQGA